MQNYTKVSVCLKIETMQVYRMPLVWMLAFLMILLPYSLHAQPVVNGETISWPDDGWYQVQSNEDYSTVCEGGTHCSVSAGTYVVINHTTQQRWEGITVVNTTESPSAQDTANNPVATGGLLSWSDDGWYQVQNAETYLSVCEGGTSCSLPSGRYNVINHTTGERWDGIMVSVDEADTPTMAPSGSDPYLSGNSVYWAADGWYEVQNSSDYSTVCEGGRSCELAPGDYVVINHDLDSRWSFFLEGAVVEPENLVQPPVVNGLVISWSDSGWYQVQSVFDYSTICEGGNTCTVVAGTYNVVNHSTGDRWDNIVVSGSELNPEPEPEPEPEVPAGDLFSALDFTVVDAEFSEALDRIIIVSANPNQLVIYNGETHESHAVDLPTTATSVSLGPDGTHAAVGHSTSVSYVNLITSQLLKTIPVSTEVLDVVLGTDDYVYAFPTSTDNREIVSLNLTTEQEIRTVYSRIHPGGTAKLHPDGQKMYASDGRGVSPGDIYEISIENGIIREITDSPYHGDFDMCDKLWLSNSGNQVFTGCGNTFRTSYDPDDTMRYMGSMSELEGIKYLHHSDKAFKFAVIPDASHYSASDDAATDTEFQLYSDTFRQHIKTRTLPSIDVGGRPFKSHGQYIFFNGNGTQLYVIVRADPAAGLLNDFAIWTTPTDAIDPPVSNPQPTVDNPIVSNGIIRWAGDDVHEVYLRLDNRLMCTGGNECSVGPGIYTLVNTVTDQRWENLQVTFALPLGLQPAVDSNADELHVVDYDVVDAEYSLSLDRMILVSSTPPALHIVGGSPLEKSVVELYGAPSSVSVSPDGKYAAVAHDGWVSYVDLVAEFVQATHPMENSGGDVVLASNGYAYIFPLSDQWVSIHSIDLINGGESLSYEAAVYEGTKAKLHPTSDVIYAVDYELERFEATAGAIAVDYQYRDSDEYATCDDLWMSQDGRRIFTQCANVFRASSVSADDMSYNGTLSEVDRILHLNHSAAADNFALIPMAPEWWHDDQTVSNDQIQIYGYEILEFRDSLALPTFLANGEPYQAFGRFVFHNAAGDRLYVVLQAGPDSGLVNNVGFWNTKSPQ